MLGSIILRVNDVIQLNRMLRSIILRVNDVIIEVGETAASSISHRVKTVTTVDCLRLGLDVSEITFNALHEGSVVLHRQLRRVRQIVRAKVKLINHQG